MFGVNPCGKPDFSACDHHPAHSCDGHARPVGVAVCEFGDDGFWGSGEVEGFSEEMQAAFVRSA